MVQLHSCRPWASQQQACKEMCATLTAAKTGWQLLSRCSEASTYSSTVQQETFLQMQQSCHKEVSGQVGGNLVSTCMQTCCRVNALAVFHSCISRHPRQRIPHTSGHISIPLSALPPLQ